jgi:hypothetical protein
MEFIPYLCKRVVTDHVNVLSPDQVLDMFLFLVEFPPHNSALLTTAIEIVKYVPAEVP